MQLVPKGHIERKVLCPKEVKRVIQVNKSEWLDILNRVTKRKVLQRRERSE